jgi:sulfur carrier protein
MDIILNGEPITLPQSMTLAQLLAERGWIGQRVAVERNGEIVPRSHYAMTSLDSGDRLELVMAVGGG